MSSTRTSSIPCCSRYLHRNRRSTRRSVCKSWFYYCSIWSNIRTGSHRSRPFVSVRCSRWTRARISSASNSKSTLNSCCSTGNTNRCRSRYRLGPVTTGAEIGQATVVTVTGKIEADGTDWRKDRHG